MAILASFPSPPVGGIDIGFTEVRVYGILIATAVLVAASWTRRRYQALGGSGELADRVTVWAVVIAFVGARLAYVAPRYDQFLDDPLGIVQIWEGGLALYGGLTFGLIALVVLLRRWDGDFPGFMDALAPALPLAQAIGRWGNYFNQELYGTPTDLPWAVEIDQPVARYAEFSTFHPTFLYESLANLVLVAVVLRAERRGRLRRGSLILVYAVGYGLIRFLLELIRTDTTFRIAGLSRNALVSLVLVGVALVLLRRLQAMPGLRVGEPLRAADPDALEADALVADADAGDPDLPGEDEPSEAAAVLVRTSAAEAGVPAAAPEEDRPDGGDDQDGDDDPGDRGDPAA
jgi:prolipoprotein diacylglyceryl transferase